MDIKWMLQELWCDIKKKEDINKKSSILSEIFYFCERAKIAIQDDAQIKKDWNKLRFYPTWKNRSHYITVQVTGNKVEKILEKQAA